MAQSHDLPDRQRRRFLKATGAAALATPWIVGSAKSIGASTLEGLRSKVEHIVVIYQENRSFDHYFGTYKSPKGHPVSNLLDNQGNIDRHFQGLQKNPEGVPYGILPVDTDIEAFTRVSLPNAPFHLEPYIPADANVPYDPEHHFFRMYLQVNDGAMDRFVGLALKQHMHGLEEQLKRIPKRGGGDYHEMIVRMLMEQSKPSGVVLGHYERADIPDYHRLADEYVLFDHFFQAMSGGSTGNALYLAAARSCEWKHVPEKFEGQLTPPILDKHYDHKGILINDLPPLLGPTETDYNALKIAPPPTEQRFLNVGDLLNQAGYDWAWYAEGWEAVKPWALKNAFGPGDGSAVIQTTLTYCPHHNPFQYFPRWPKYVRNGHIRDMNDFRADATQDKLPAVSFLKASSAHDEHPANSSPVAGMNWVVEHLRIMAESPVWDKTLVVVTYDEGGGYWDHLAPPRPDGYGNGTRIPALMIGPYVKRGYIDPRVADTTSILKLIERRFDLPALTARDAKAYDLMDGLDFSQPARELSI